MRVAIAKLVARLPNEPALTEGLADILAIESEKFKEIIPDVITDNLLEVWTTSNSLSINYETAIFFVSRIIAGQAFMPRKDWRVNCYPIYHRYLTYFQVNLTDYIMPVSIHPDLIPFNED